MDGYGRRHGVLRPVVEDLYHLAPVPVVYRVLDVADLSQLNRALIDEARATYGEEALEVPDRRQAQTLGNPPESRDDIWSETQSTPVGIWHRVPTNNFLDQPAECVVRLRRILEERYLFALAATGEADGTDAIEPWISESWIQFYKNGDDKVLHSHDRYGPPYPEHPWAGAYYLHDGDPDATMPYSGVFSFRIRDTNYFIRPKPGLLVIWPASVLHEVHPFYGRTERIVINFNINSRSRRGG